MNAYYTGLIAIFVIIVLIVALFLIPTMKDIFFPAGTAKDRDPFPDVVNNAADTSKTHSLDFNSNEDNEIDTTYDEYGTEEKLIPDDTPVFAYPCIPTNCQNYCNGIRSFSYDGTCISNTCYCLHLIPQINPPLTIRATFEVPSPSDTTFYCRSYATAQASSAGVVVYYIQGSGRYLIQDSRHYCIDQNTRLKYSCEVRELYVPEGERLMQEDILSTEENSCEDSNCGPYFSGGCVNGQCTCVSNISEEFLNYAITSYLVEESSKINKDHISILMHAYENQLNEGDVPLLEEAIEVVEAQIYDKDGNLKINYDLIN